MELEQLKIQVRLELDSFLAQKLCFTFSLTGACAKWCYSPFPSTAEHERECGDDRRMCEAYYRLF